MGFLGGIKRYSKLFCIQISEKQGKVSTMIEVMVNKNFVLIGLHGDIVEVFQKCICHGHIAT